MNGVGQCVFTRPAKVSKVISNDEEHEFDLIKNDYFVLLAMGTMAGMKHSFNTNLDNNYMTYFYMHCTETMKFVLIFMN